MSKRTAFLLAQTYLNREGTKPLYSGVQRYIRECARLFLSANIEPVIIQKAERSFRVEHEGATVIGMPAGITAASDPWFNYRAHRLIPADSPVLYCVLELANPVVRPNSVALQHGIWWNGAYARWKFPFIRGINRRVLQRVGAVICVDTNYINWCLSVLRHPRELLAKCHYIPNFVDPEEFPRTPAEPKENDPPVVLFPRRCSLERGALLFLDSCFQLWDQGYRFRAVFCGFGALQEHVVKTAASKGYADAVRVCDVAFGDMAAMYKSADIVVVPSIWCEGTSLSCIEAMYLGKPIVSTFIGGLPNLIMPGYNGELVQPRPDSLAEGIARLLTRPELRALYGRRAMDVADGLTIHRWREAAWQVISRHVLS